MDGNLSIGTAEGVGRRKNVSLDLQQTRKVVVANLRGVRKGREYFVVVDEGMRMRFGVCCGIFSLSRRFMNKFIDNKKRITDGESRVEVLMN